MSREFYAQAVIKAYDESGALRREDLMPIEAFDKDGAELLRSKELRLSLNIQFISVRTFDQDGKRGIDWRLRYDQNGTLLPAT